MAMLRRAVQKRPYDWEPLLAPKLQAYRSTISESTGFTPYTLAFGREMRLPIDFGTSLPELPRDIRPLARKTAEDLEWCYRIANEITGFSHRRAENRYNERTVDKTYRPGALVRVVQHTHPSGVPSNFNSKYSGLCEVLEIRGAVLTLRELDSRKVFTANNDAVRSSSLSQPDAMLPAVPADLRLFDMSLSRPEDEIRDFSDTEVLYNPEIESTGDPLIQSMNFSLPDAGLNPVVLSLLDLQCSPSHAVLPQSRSLRVRPTRRPRAFTPLYTSTQAEIPSLLSIPATSPSAPISDAADTEFLEPRGIQRKQTQFQSVRKNPEKPVTIVTAATRNRQIELRPSSNRSRSADTRNWQIDSRPSSNRSGCTAVHNRQIESRPSSNRSRCKSAQNRKIESRPSSNRSRAAAIQSQKLELDADRDGCRAENSQVNRVAKLQVARIAVLPRDQTFSMYLIFMYYVCHVSGI